MRYRFVWMLMLALLAGRAAWAQCGNFPPQAGCANGIVAFADGVTPAVELGTICVGQRVRFEICNPPAGAVLSLQVLPGDVPPPADCNPNNQVTLPTTAGPITVIALINPGNNLPAIFYRRVFQLVDSSQPDFTVAPCSNGLALLSLQSGTSYDQYFVRFGTSGPLQGPFTQGATIPPLATGGATSVTVIGRYAANSLCENSRTLPFTNIAAPLPPTISRLTQASGTGGPATLTLSNIQADYRYSLQQSTASGFQTIAAVPNGSSTFALAGAATGCYRLLRTDVCEQNPTPSVPICALNLTVVDAPGVNELTFAYDGAVSSYDIYRNGTLLTTVTAPSYSDAAVTCGSSYTYYVVANLPTGEKSESNPQTRTARSNNIPPPVPPLVASFTLANTVSLTPVLNGQRVPRGSTLLYRKTAGARSNPDFARDTTGLTILDPTVFDSLRLAPPCYTVRFIDRCGVQSATESAPTCPAFLSATPADPEGSTVSLSWSSFTGPNPAAPTTYELLRLAPDGNVLDVLPVSGNTATDLTPPTNRQVLRYRLRISGGGIPADTFSYSNVASVARRVRLQLPTAFTPNGDGLNDVLEVKGRFLENYTFVVVDRNGMEVFRSTERSETWDGRIKGHAPVNGTYVWRYQQIDETGRTVRETGTITILQ